MKSRRSGNEGRHLQLPSLARACGQRLRHSHRINAFPNCSGAIVPPVPPVSPVSPLAT